MFVLVAGFVEDLAERAENVAHVGHRRGFAHQPDAPDLPFNGPSPAPISMLKSSSKRCGRRPRQRRAGTVTA